MRTVGRQGHGHACARAAAVGFDASLPTRGCRARLWGVASGTSRRPNHRTNCMQHTRSRVGARLLAAAGCCELATHTHVSHKVL